MLEICLKIRLAQNVRNTRVLCKKICNKMSGDPKLFLLKDQKKEASEKPMEACCLLSSYWSLSLCDRGRSLEGAHKATRNLITIVTPVYATSPWCGSWEQAGGLCLGLLLCLPKSGRSYRSRSIRLSSEKPSDILGLILSHALSEPK